MTLRERRRPGEFILSEADGFRSRSAMTIAAGLVLEAGAVLQAGDDGAAALDAGTCIGSFRYRREWRFPLTSKRISS